MLKKNPKLGYSPKTGKANAVIVIDGHEIAGIIVYPSGALDIQLDVGAVKAKAAKTTFNRLKREFDL